MLTRALARTDGVLLGAVLALAFLGAVMVHSASAAVALDRTGATSHYFLRHLLALSVAALALATAWAFPPARLRDPRMVWTGVGAVGVLLVWTLFQPPVNDVTRWIRLGSLSLQPAECAKPVLVWFLADRLSRKADSLGEWKPVILPSLGVLGGFMLLIAVQPDVGTPVVLLLVFGALLFLGGVPQRVVLGIGAAAAILLAAYALSAEYRMERFRTFFHPEADPLGAGYQVHQSLLAVGSGGIAGANHEGLLGTALGAGMQKLFYLPYPHTDFLFAVVGEEMGLIGTAGIVGLYGVILVRGFRTSSRAPDRFGTLWAAGLTMLLVGQAFLNIGVVLDLVPTKGFPLPFVSYGGTSLVVAAASAGFLLREGAR